MIVIQPTRALQVNIIFFAESSADYYDSFCPAQSIDRIPMKSTNRKMMFE